MLPSPKSSMISAHQAKEKVEVVVTGAQQSEGTIEKLVSLSQSLSGLASVSCRCHNSIRAFFAVSEIT